MNTVVVDHDELVVTPRGMDKIWGFRREIRVPLSHVRGATADPGAADEPRGIRAPGLSIPGKVVGTFVKDGEKTFWNIGDQRRDVVIDLVEEDLARLVLTVDDPAAVERAVNAALHHGT